MKKIEIKMYSIYILLNIVYTRQRNNNSNFYVYPGKQISLRVVYLITIIYKNMYYITTYTVPSIYIIIYFFYISLVFISMFANQRMQHICVYTNTNIKIYLRCFLAYLKLHQFYHL